jgi:hypothetical protein
MPGGTGDNHLRYQPSAFLEPRHASVPDEQRPTVGFAAALVAHVATAAGVGTADIRPAVLDTRCSTMRLVSLSVP